MAYFESGTQSLGPFQQGNLADVEVELDTNFPMTGVTVTFQVWTVGGLLIINKTSANQGIIVNGQYVRVPLEPAVMNRIGKHQYEMNFLDVQQQSFATINGAFEIKNK